MCPRRIYIRVQGVVDAVNTPHTPGERSGGVMIPAVIPFPNLQAIRAGIQMLQNKSIRGSCIIIEVITLVIGSTITSNTTGIRFRLDGFPVGIR